jgi:hypothetical protein
LLKVSWLNFLAKINYGKNNCYTIIISQESPAKIFCREAQIKTKFGGLRPLPTKLYKSKIVKKFQVEILHLDFNSKSTVVFLAGIQIDLRGH